MLLLGPETSEQMRIRATRRLARQGSQALPLILATLSSYPEITRPAWPCWPPQYAYCSHLLLHICKKFSLPLHHLLHYPDLKQPPGPVLWISIIEADATNETVLRQGLELPWITARYAAAMALAMCASQKSLSTESLLALHCHLHANENHSVRLGASYALLVSGEHIGLEALIQLLHPLAPEEARKAALFVLATELPYSLSTEERTLITEHLLLALNDPQTEIAFQATHALSKIAQPNLIPIVSEFLWQHDLQLQMIALCALEEMALREDLRQKMRHLSLPTRLLPLLQSDISEIRRQACCTLARCGGNFVLAALGTLLLDPEHPGYLEALECLRLLQGVFQVKIRSVVVHWLLTALQQPREEVQITALDSLASLLWQAHTQRRMRAWSSICQQIMLDGTVLELLDAPGAWVRQRSIELLSMFDVQLAKTTNFHARLLTLLHDPDSGVRACAAFVCGQIGGHWALSELILTLLDRDKYVAETALNALFQCRNGKNAIIFYVIKELAGFSNARPPFHSSTHLNQAARLLLKRWQDAREPESWTETYAFVPHDH